MYVLELAGEDDRFAAAEAASAAAGVEVVAPGVALARSVEERARRLAFTRRASRLVGRTRASVADARRLLATVSLDPPGAGDAGGGDRAGPEQRGTVAVRARDVRSTAGVSTSDAERELGSVLVERGFAVDLDDPDRELRAVFAGDVCALGWLAFETDRGYGARAPTDRPFFQPGSMAPRLARALVNLAGARPGATLLDPMCGTGGVLAEAGLVGARPVGLDAQYKMVRGSRQNLRALPGAPDAPPGANADFEVVRGDATRLPFRDGTADAVVFDAPYGRQSKVVSESTDDLVAGALREARRVSRGRAVVVGDRDWSDAAREAGFDVAGHYERRVHGSLTRHVIVARR